MNISDSVDTSVFWTTEADGSSSAQEPDYSLPLDLARIEVLGPADVAKAPRLVRAQVMLDFAGSVRRVHAAVRVGGSWSTRIKRNEAQSVLMKADEYSIADVEQYNRHFALLDRLTSGIAAPEPLDASAAKTAQKWMTGIMMAGFPPPHLHAQGDDAVLLTWELGRTSLTVVVTDGQLGMIEEREGKITRETSDVSIDGAWAAII